MDLGNPVQSSALSRVVKDFMSCHAVISAPKKKSSIIQIQTIVRPPFIVIGWIGAVGTITLRFG